MTLKNVLILILVCLFSACSTPQNKPSSATVESREAGGNSSGSGSGSDGSEVTTYGSGSNGSGDMSALDDPQNRLSVRTIYFEFDSSEIQSQFRDIIEAHSTYLISNPETVISLEGHADERGSREYNLALGERRSQTVKRQMVLLGVHSRQITTTSYGEERAVSEEHDEFAWSQNRRVEIIY
jgi:peptidoglycan-associated lipoprotein